MDFSTAALGIKEAKITSTLTEWSEAGAQQYKEWNELWRVRTEDVKPQDLKKEEEHSLFEDSRDEELLPEIWRTWLYFVW